MRIIGGHRFGLGMVCLLTWSVLLFTGAGCSEKPGTAPRSARTPGTKVTPRDLTGRWVLQYVQLPNEVSFALLDISHAKEKYDVKLVGVDKLPVPIEVKNVDINDDGQVRMEIGTGEVAWSFQGRLDGDHVWGTMMLPHFQIAPAKLQRSELQEIDPEHATEQVSTIGDFMAAQNAADKFVALDEFVKKPQSHRSPLLIEAYAVLAQFLKSEKFSQENVEKFIERYREAIDIWGPRMAPRVDLEVGQALAGQKIYPELSKKLLAQAEEKITPEYPLEWRAQLAESWILAEEHERGLKLLGPLREQDPTDPLLHMVYARAKEMAKDNEEALKSYAALAVLPQFESMLKQRGQNPNLTLPSEAVARLWKEKHGSTQGLDEYLRTAYEEQMALFVPKRTPGERIEKGQTILLELFTGAACNPCVPADIAIEALRKAYSPQELVIVKYHVHAPLPDPLSSDAIMKRFSYYDGNSTPMMYVNGLYVDGVGGYVQQASRLTNQLRTGLDQELTKTSKIDLKLSATRNGDDITIKASVNGIETTDNDPRLILVLLENDITFAAPNGIKIHNCVARGFAGDSVGIKLRPGEIDHERTISLAKLKAELLTDLKPFEDQAGRPFPAKPMSFAKLQVAAIIQNHITKSYIQSGLTDVVLAE